VIQPLACEGLRYVAALLSSPRSPAVDPSKPAVLSSVWHRGRLRANPAEDGGGSSLRGSALLLRQMIPPKLPGMPRHVQHACMSRSLLPTTKEGARGWACARDRAVHSWGASSQDTSPRGHEYQPTCLGQIDRDNVIGQVLRNHVRVENRSCQPPSSSLEDTFQSDRGIARASITHQGLPCTK